MKKYLTHLPIKDTVFDALKKEFYLHENKARKYSAGHVTLENVDIIRLTDVEECKYANIIADKLSSKINCEVKPRYVRQVANTSLKPHKDLGTNVCINVLLQGTAPIIFDYEHEFNYKCAVLNVSKTHQVDSLDTRLFFRLSMNAEIYYNDFLKRINGIEEDIFDIDL
jgi:hypothetical protein